MDRKSEYGCFMPRRKEGRVKTTALLPRTLADHAYQQCCPIDCILHLASKCCELNSPSVASGMVDWNHRLLLNFYFGFKLRDGPTARSYINGLLLEDCEVTSQSPKLSIHLMFDEFSKFSSSKNLFHVSAIVPWKDARM